MTAHHIATNLDVIDLQKRAYAPDFATAAGVPGEVRCVFQRADLVWDVDTLFAVRPMNCFGRKCAPLVGSIHLKSPSGV